MKQLSFLAFICLATTLYANTTVTLFTSFECKKVTVGSVEERICKDVNLSALDEELNQLYESFYLLTSELKQSQAQWLQTRNICKTNVCLKHAYQERIQTLQTAYAVQEEFPKEMLDIFKEKEKFKDDEIDIISNGTDDAGFPKANHVCESFYHDLFLFKDVHVVKPILDKVDYNNTQLKEMLGVCHKMYMNYKQFPRSVPYLNTKFYAWYSDVDGDGVKEFLFGQGSPHDTQADVYLLDEALCKEAIAEPMFDEYSDQKYIAHSVMYGHGNAIVEYRGKGYLMEASAYDDNNLTDEMYIRRRDVLDVQPTCFYGAEKNETK